MPLLAGRLDTHSRWDLNWQRDFTFVASKVAARDALSGTRLAVECVYENHTDAPVVGGLGSDDEMCFNFSYISVAQDEQSLDGNPRKAAVHR